MVPENISQMTVTPDKVLAEAFANRSAAIGFLRRMGEANAM